MNEESKSLIEDMRWEARTKVTGKSNVSYAFTPDELEKFATLIIQECIKVADDSQYKCRTFPVSTTIRDHFGIK